MMDANDAAAGDETALSAERLAEIRAMLNEVDHARERLHGLMGGPDRPRAPMVHAASELLAEVDRLRAENAYLQQGIDKLLHTYPNIHWHE